VNYSKRWFLPPQLDFLIAAKLIHLVSDVVFEGLDVLLVGATVDEVEEDTRGRFYPHLGFLGACGHHMDGDVLAQRKQTHPMPRRDGEGLVVTFDTLELAALLDGFLRGGIDTTGRLGEGEGGFTHWVTCFRPSFSKCPDTLTLGRIAAKYVCRHIWGTSSELNKRLHPIQYPHQ